MSTLGIFLALFSALLHSIWNYLSKRSKNPIPFISLLFLSATLITLPLAVYDLFEVNFSAVNWSAVIWSCVFEVIYVITLAYSYQFGNLSMSYPISRGMLPISLIVITPFFISGQELSIQGFSGVILVIIGIFAMFLPDISAGGFQAALRALNHKANWLAILSGLMIACYSLAYKIALPTISPISLLWLSFVAISIFIVPISIRVCGFDEFKLEWRLNRTAIISAGLFSFASFLIFLLTVRLLNLTYISALRNTSIIFSVALGAFMLKEKVTVSHWIGALIIAGGCTLIAFA